MTATTVWKTDIRSALAELNVVFEHRFGYPPGANFVRDADVGQQGRTGNVVLPSALAAFYAEVGQLSLPDVHIGYFIHPVDVVIKAINGHPTRVEVEINDDVVTFGSDGGGGLFCLTQSNGVIYHLPPGRIDENNVYSGGLCQPRLVASNLEAFLQRILMVTKEFVIDHGTACI